MDVSKVERVGQVVYWTTTEEGLEQAKLSAVSVHEVMPDARLYLYCDRTLKNVGSWPSQVIRMDFDRYPLMVGNLVAQAHFALKYLDLPTAFLDTDILLCAPLEIAPAVDLAITCRDYVGKTADGEKIAGVAESMPYNYGVLMARPTIGAIEAFLWLRDRVSRLAPHLQAWYGNQVALRELAGAPLDKHFPHVARRSLPWVDILISVLDAEAWNYTPEKPDEELAGKRILHLKGVRKSLMPHYLGRILEEVA